MSNTDTQPTIPTNVRLTKDQLEACEQAAAKCGLRVSTWIRMVALLAADRKQIKKLREEVAWCVENESEYRLSAKQIKALDALINPRVG